MPLDSLISGGWSLDITQSFMLVFFNLYSHRPAGSDRSKRQLFTTTAATKMQRMSSQRRLFVQPLKSQQLMRPRSPLDFAGVTNYHAHVFNVFI